MIPLAVQTLGDAELDRIASLRDLNTTLSLREWLIPNIVLPRLLSMNHKLIPFGRDKLFKELFEEIAELCDTSQDNT